MIRVGRCTYDKKGVRTDPSYPGFTPIVCLTKSTKYGSLGPYVLKNEKGQIIENYYQASKIYKEVPKSLQRYSRYDKTIIWDHPAEVHVNDKNEVTEEYWKWREKLMNNPHPVRYPTGYEHNQKKLCIGSIIEYDDGTVEGPLDYITARKRIYIPEYCKAVKKEPLFRELKRKLAQGENLLIIEVDVAPGHDLQYYKDKYDVDDDFIKDNTMLINQQNIHIMLNDPKNSFGHGMALAMALLDKDVEWNF